MLDWIEQRGVKWSQGQAERMSLDLYREKKPLGGRAGCSMVYDGCYFDV